MRERSIHAVQIAVLDPYGHRQKTTTISWETRQLPVEQLRRHEEMCDLAHAFDAVGTSRPVEVTPEQNDDLVRLILGMGSLEDLAAGIRRLFDDLTGRAEIRLDREHEFLALASADMKQAAAAARLLVTKSLSK